MNENEMAMTCGVETFLESIGLHDYASTFLAKGFDRETDIQHLGDSDLDTMLISDPGHRRSLISAARKHKPSEDGTLLQWLREYELEHYFIGFVRSELVEMEEIARLNLPDTNIYDELEISMPGHQRRLERAVRQLNKRRRHEENAELPVTEGFWGKPTNLEDAKYDFLCVEATISSTKDTSRSHTIDFMVDSGSDVTTLQEELLYTLNPELIGPINSKGVHSSCRKNLYRAKLTVGSHDLEIEVMGESYNSLGSRVLRHFRHYITGSKHIWLPGDYFDPVMSTGLKMLSADQNTSQKTEEMVDPTNLLNESSASEHSAGETSMDLSNVGHEETSSVEDLLEHETSDILETSIDHEASIDHETSLDNETSIDHETSKHCKTSSDHETSIDYETSIVHETSRDHETPKHHETSINHEIFLEQTVQKDSINRTLPEKKTNCSNKKDQLSTDQKCPKETHVSLEQESSVEQTPQDTSISLENRACTGENHDDSFIQSNSSKQKATKCERLSDYPSPQESATDETDNVGTLLDNSNHSKHVLSYRNISQKTKSCDFVERHVISNLQHEKCKDELTSVQSPTDSTFRQHGFKSTEDCVDGVSLNNGHGIRNGLHS